MKKLIFSLVLISFLFGPSAYLQTKATTTNTVNLNQPFSIGINEEMQLNGYPVSIVYESFITVNCFTTPCPGNSATFGIHYPTGYKNITVSEGQTLSYKGASMVVTNITSQSATIYASATTLPHSVGSNVAAPDGTVWYITKYYTRRAYPSANVFLSYKFNTWSNVVTANSADLNLPIHDWAYNNYGSIMMPRSGSLLNDNGTIYITNQWMKSGFASEAVFAGSTGVGFNYSYLNVYPASTVYLSDSYPLTTSSTQHPDGTLINDNGTLYVMANGAKYGVPSLAVLDSWGYWLTDAVTANSYDRESYTYSTLQMRLPDQLNVGE